MKNSAFTSSQLIVAGAAIRRVYYILNKMIIDLAIKAKNFKSIGSTEEGFESIYPINVIIGRNNTGKSTLLDLIHYVISPGSISLVGHKGNPPEILLTKPLTQQEISSTFPGNISGGSIGGNHLKYGMQWQGKPFTVKLLSNAEKEFMSTEPLLEQGSEYHKRLATHFENYLLGKIFRRVRADRDIVPEPDTTKVEVDDNGTGATNLIQLFYNKEERDRSVITKLLLNALNEIFSPDLFFKEILVRQKGNSTWEIFLYEENKGHYVPLSDSGSGLKTVILVLVNLLLVPKTINVPLSQFVFAFEELENNLHPGLQRRLFNYLRNIAIQETAIFFLTTHSNVVIDLFNKDENSQIVHVTHNGEFSSVKKVVTYIENKGILDDLDIRASDLLQSNGVVWLEGPSDRLFFNRWIALWSDDQIKEGIHYQCVFYGGRLLAHLTALNEETEEEKEVNILKVNRNAIILMDSDKSTEKEKLNATKNRLIAEISSVGGYSWVTSGREIENYLSMESLNQAYGNTVFTEIAPFDKFEDYMNNKIKGEGDKFLRNKVLFAEKVLPYLSKENLEPIFDLNTRLSTICEIIQSWNSITQKK